MWSSAALRPNCQTLYFNKIFCCSLMFRFRRFSSIRLLHRRRFNFSFKSNHLVISCSIQTKSTMTKEKKNLETQSVLLLLFKSAQKHILNGEFFFPYILIKAVDLANNKSPLALARACLLYYYHSPVAMFVQSR